MSTKYPGGFITKNYTAPTPTSAPGVWTLEQQEQAQKAGIWPYGGPFNYIEDVFSTYLFTGNGSSQAINNGIDLAGKGGLVWIKNRGAVGNHAQFDTARGADYRLASNLSSAQGTGLYPNYFGGFSSTGFSLGSSADSDIGSGSTGTYASWTFRKQPKFFDVVTYTGDGTAGRTVAHSLGSTPGCIIVKKTNAAREWAVYHRSLGASKAMVLNTTAAVYDDTTSIYWNNTAPTSSVFSVGTSSSTNLSGDTYVAYIFAHDAGGFGLTGTDNVISCGSYSGNGTGNNAVTLGYEPQFLIIKNTQDVTQWTMTDVMRGMSNTTTNADATLFANLSNAEQVSSTDTHVYPTATGFVLNSASGNYNASGKTYIYIAIRKGPMKVPTDATKVFKPITATGGSNYDVTFSGMSYVDNIISYKDRTAGTFNTPVWNDRFRGFPSDMTGSTYVSNPGLASSAADAEFTGDIQSNYLSGVTMNRAVWGGGWSGYQGVFYGFQRAPGFFDEVCYTGNGTTQNLTHNLGAIPGLIFVKRRGASTGSWLVWSTTLSSYSSVSPTYYGMLNSTAAFYGAGYGNETVWGNNTNTVDPTSSVFTVGSASPGVNGSGSTYVAYLFASCPGVSKIGSYTGTGATQTISCGFTGGARFVMIKRTDSTGNWYIWDTARGMISGTDPSNYLNATNSEINTNSVYTTTGGFQIVSTAADINASGGTYIYLAIA